MLRLPWLMPALGSAARSGQRRDGQRAARRAAGHRQRAGLRTAAGAENLTLTVQDEPAAIEPPQLFVWLNGPVTPIEETDAALLPELVTVTDWAALVDPEFTSPNDRLVGDAVSAPGCAGSGETRSARGSCSSRSYRCRG